MPNMIKSGLDWARDQLKANVATSIKIRRGALTSLVITAVKAGPEADQFDDAGAFVQRIRKIDWLIDPADYQLDGDLVLPADDDVIEEVNTDEEVLATYIVSSPNVGDPPWRYTDAERTMLRVHVAEE
jgi:hypothetical protein